MKKISEAVGQKHTRTLPIVTILLALLVGASLFLRLYLIGSLPAALNRDEAALAYNALLLQKTGQDEWGVSWPIALRSFGDYKLPGYPILIIASMAVFGNTDVAVRLPSALAGTGLVMISFYFARNILRLSPPYALITATALSLQPVFFFYSRMAWEANVGLFFFVTGLYALLVKQKQRWAELGARSIGVVLLIIAAATYNTPLLLLPFLCVSLWLWHDRIKWGTTLAVSAILVGVFLYGLVLFSDISQQKQAITIFHDETIWKQSVDYYESFDGPWRTVLGNRFIFFGRILIEHTVSTLSPQFLVREGGGHPWHSIPGTGHLFAATYFLALIGAVGTLYRFFTHTNKKKVAELMLPWLVVTSLVPAIITVDAPHATRSLFFFFLLVLLVGRGLEVLFSDVFPKQNGLDLRLRFFCMLLLVIGSAIEVRQYYSQYFLRYPEQSAQILQKGLGATLRGIEEQLGDRADQVAVVDPDGYLYTRVAWELQMSPEAFRSSIVRHLPDRIGFTYGYRVGRYRFIASAQDQTPEDVRIVEWDPTLSAWVIE